MAAVRLATNADGPRIGELLTGMGFRDALDWSDIAPYWLVAEEEGRIIGAVQTVLGKPVGWMELLSIDPGLSHKRKAMVVRALIYRGMALLQGAGAQMVMFSVPHELRSYRAVLERRGGVVVGAGNIMAKRLI
jgi:N-acetylglutamate synthase-like GNAT family acetyltransferase